MRKHDVFLSYSRQNTQQMHRIRSAFLGFGISVWTDEHIKPGTDSWVAAIEQAIDQAGVLVVLLSPDAKNSEWVKRELHYARLQEKMILSVLLDGNTKTSVPFEIAGNQFVDIRKTFDGIEEKLIPSIAEHLDIKITVTENLNESISQYEERVKQYEEDKKATEIKLSKLLYQRANLAVSRKEYEKAIQDLTQAINGDPGNSLYYEARGNIYVQVEDYEKALKDIEKVAGWDVYNEDNWQYVGWLYQKVDDLEGALRHYQWMQEFFMQEHYATYVSDIKKLLGEKNSDSN